MGVIFRNGIPYGGGGGGAPIEAEENQILVGDGEDWAKGGSFNEVKAVGDTISGHKEYFISGPSNLIEDEETNETIETPTSFYFGGGGEVEEVEVQEGGETIIKERITGDCYLNVKDNATGTFKDSSSIIIENNSDIEIGKTGHEFTLFRDLGQNPKTLSSPFIRIQDAAYMVVDASTAQTGPPVTLIHGGFLCDISDGQDTNNNNIKRLNNPFDPAGRNNYGSPGSPGDAYPLCPWTENGSWTDQIGPILYLHQNPTIMMENAPVLSMRGRSVLQMEGDAHVHLETLDSRETSFIMQTGSLFRMNGNADSDPNYTVGILADSLQLFAGRLSSDAKGNNFSPNDNYRYYWEDNALIWKDIYTGFGTDGPFLTWTSKKIDPTPVRGPQFLIEAQPGSSSVFHLYSNYNGRTFLDRSSEGGGIIIDDIYTETGGKITSLIGARNNGHYLKDFSVDGGKLGVNVLISSDSNAAVSVTPHGKTSINFSPQGFYGYIENSHNIYRYISHPDYYQEYVDGDVFKQYNGYCHIESQDGSSLILRDKQNKTKVEGFIGISHTSEGYVTILTTTDYSNLTFEDLKANDNDFTQFKNQVNSDKRNDVYAKINYETGGQIVSSTKVSDNYYSTVINNYVYSVNENHVEKSWNCPIQSPATNMPGPIIQIYNNSNFLMRGAKEDNFDTLSFYISKTQFPTLFTNTSDLIITDPIEIVNIIQLLETDSNIADQINEKMTVTYQQGKVVKILNPGVLTTVSSKKIQLFIDYIEWGDTEFQSDKPIHLIRNENAPTVEFNDAAYLFMTGRSELKLEDGTIIKAKNNNGTMEYTFGDESDSNNQVTFSISELKALKALLTRTWTGPESDYQNIQNPDSNTLYYTWDDNE